VSDVHRDFAPDSAFRYDRRSGVEIARVLALPRVVLYESIGSTLDAAHALAEQGAPAGTLILADAQTSGRGRMGRSWRSEPGAGIWMTLIERPRDLAALAVLSLRVGLALAPVLEPFAAGAICLKWPNDIYVGDRKLAGILTEARWRDAMPEWVAIGIGINGRAPSAEPRATGLRTGVSRLDVLAAVLPAVRTAAALANHLSDEECGAFADRHVATGRACAEPRQGIVRGIDASGALLIDVPSGVVAVRAGSLVLTEDT
jgi:BirA family transcriptional regulator, biotin operon repressor / biotin---[acetyl-CoA-carboxylase] ligase